MGATVTFSDEIEQWRETVRRTLPAFLKDARPRLVGEVIDRSSTELPEHFVTWAPVIVLPSERLLRAAGSRPGSSDLPAGWRGNDYGDVFHKPARREDNQRCLLRVGRWGELWTIENDFREALVLSFGSLPVVTRSLPAAMRLAEYCSPQRCQAGLALKWVPLDRCGLRWLEPINSHTIAAAA